VEFIAMAGGNKGDGTAAGGSPREAPQRVDVDAQRMLAFREGDLGAFEQLVRENQAKVLSLVFRFVGNQAEAEDLAQEVFIRVFRTASRYVPRARFSTWLYRVAVNVALNALRARGKLPTVSLDVGREAAGDAFQRSLADPAAGLPHEDLAGNELAARVREAVDALPENQRIAVILSRYEQLSYEQIGQVLGCSAMAVKSLLSRAREGLRDRLAQYVRRGR
jgi:RNA polymerase sigma-70 factor (ECF subfamily)